MVLVLTKLRRFLFLLPLWAASVFAEPNIAFNPRALLKTTNTWTANQDGRFLSAQDEGTYVMKVGTINCTGAGISCTDIGNGILRINVTATGGGGGSGAGIYFPIEGVVVSTFNWSHLAYIIDGTSVTYNIPGSTFTWNAPQVFEDSTTFKGDVYFQTMIGSGTAQTFIGPFIKIGTHTAMPAFSVYSSSIVISTYGAIGFDDGTNTGDLLLKKVHANMLDLTRVSGGSLTLRLNGMNTNSGQRVNAVELLAGANNANSLTLETIRSQSPKIYASGSDIQMDAMGGAGSDIVLQTNNTSGNVGIGSSNPNSKLDVVGGSLTVRGTDSRIRVESLSGCDTIDTDASGNFVCGSDSGGSGGAGDNFGSHKPTRPVEMSNFAILGTSQATVGQSSGSALIHVYQPSDKTDHAILFTTAAEDGLAQFFSVNPSTFIVNSSTSIFNGRMIVGSTIQPTAADGFLRIGPGNDNTGLTPASGVMGLFTNQGAAVVMVRDSANNVMSKVGATSAGGVFGTHSSNNLNLRVADSDNMVMDTSNNIFFPQTNAKIAIGYGNTTTPKSLLDLQGGSVTVAGLKAALRVGTTNFHVNRGGGVAVGTPTSVGTMHIAGNMTIDTPPNAQSSSYTLRTTTGSQVNGGVVGTFTFYNFQVSSNGYIHTSSAPTHALSSCGTDPTIYGGANGFTVTPGGGGPGACTITFGIPFSNPPVVVLTPRSGVVPIPYAVTNTGIVATLANIPVFDVILLGQSLGPPGQ